MTIGRIDHATIATVTHGRYLVRVPEAPGPWPLLVGFHGYREDAAVHLGALTQIPGSERWLIVAVEGLHLFYTRTQEIVASWMTRRNRDLAIGDNVAYVGRVLDAVRAAYPTGPSLVFEGFSQGGAMAYRAAATYPAAALIILAADVPPDVAERSSVPLPRVLIGRGRTDLMCTAPQHTSDLEVLARLGVPVESCVFEGGHEWRQSFYEAAARLLADTTEPRA